MRILIFLCVIIFLLSHNIYSCAGTISPEAKDEVHIQVGNQYSSVVELSIKYKGIKQLATASAVLYKPNIIITAAHVFDDAVSVHVVVNKKRILVTKHLSYPEFDKKKYGYCDIAIGFLNEEIYIEEYPSLYEDFDELNRVCTIAGYGFTGTFVTGATKFDKQKRGGTNTIESMNRNVIICSPSRSNDITHTELEYLTSHGDSGGGLFIDNKLAGINSFVQSTDGKSDSSFSDESCHTRVSIFAPWIKEVCDK